MLHSFKKTYNLLTLSERSSLSFQFILMLLAMCTEILGVGFILPAIAFIIESKDFNFFLLERFSSVTNNLSEMERLFYGTFALCFVYFSKAAFNSFVIWRQTDFAFKLQASISLRLFREYLNKPFDFHLEKNSSELMRNVINEINVLIFSAVLPFIILISEILIISGILCLLLYIDTETTLTALIITSPACLIFYFFTRKRITSWGILRQSSEEKRIRYVQQGLNGIKDLIVTNSIPYFLSEYKQANNAAAIAGRNQKSLAQLPRVWLEVLVVFSSSAVIFMLFHDGKSTDEVLLAVGLFVAAALRLLPSASRILASAQAIRFGMPVINLIHEQFSANNRRSSVLPGGAVNDPILSSEIEIKGVSFSYASTTAAAVSKVSLSIRKGQVVGFIGTSGSGKSSLISIILGLLTPSDGQVLIDGQDLEQMDKATWRDRIGYVPQSIFLLDDSIRRNVAFGVKDEEVFEVELIEQNKASEPLVMSLPNGLDTKVGERGVRLSGGQVQRIGIARALYRGRDILILDEATSSVDEETEYELMKSINNMRGNLTIIIVAHRLSTVQQCDWICQFEKGNIVSHGRPSDILSDKKMAKGSLPLS